MSRPAARRAKPVPAHPTVVLYTVLRQPGQLVARDEHGAWVTWAAEPCGWARRTPYTGSEAEIVPADREAARGTGWPEAPRGSAPRGAPGRPLTIRLADDERHAVDSAAARDGQKPSVWAREVIVATARRNQR